MRLLTLSGSQQSAPPWRPDDIRVACDMPSVGSVWRMASRRSLYARVTLGARADQPRRAKGGRHGQLTALDRRVNPLTTASIAEGEGSLHSAPILGQLRRFGI